MFWLAANLHVNVSAEQARLAGRDQLSWRRLERSVATIFNGERAMGPAALVDASGLFVAHMGAVANNTVDAQLGDQKFRLVVVNRERNTELVLLRAEGATEFGRPLRATKGDRPEGTIFAVLSTGPIRADLVPSQRVGVLGSTRRVVPIAEVRFEAPQGQFGTGLLLTEGGELFGTLNAALAKPETPRSSPTGLSLNGQTVGPMSMTVAYSVGPQFVGRVLDGFLSPDHQVRFPSLGVMCVDALGGGATVQVVHSGSPAEAAGLRVGDILQNIGGSAIRNQLDFASTMLKQEIGKKVPIQVKRGSYIQIRDVVIGEAKQ